MFAHAALLRQKLQIKMASQSIYSILTPGQPVQMQGSHQYGHFLSQWADLGLNPDQQHSMWKLWEDHWDDCTNMKLNKYKLNQNQLVSATSQILSGLHESFVKEYMQKFWLPHNPVPLNEGQAFSVTNLWGLPFLVRILCMRPFFNPTIVVVTFRLQGWCMLGVFLLPAFTRPRHECQDILSLCDGMNECTDKTSVIQKSFGEWSQNPC